MYEDILHYNLDPGNEDNYRKAAAAYLHYIHGVNPVGIVYLTNMYAYGATRSANEMYHGWFGHGTVWDDALTSPAGPPPGYLTGGPEHGYKPNDAYKGAPIEPPMNQPAMKSYKDWNAGWPDDSWEITEPDLGYQASYVRLLGSVMDTK
jgi:hypothetical protein